MKRPRHVVFIVCLQSERASMNVRSVNECIELNHTGASLLSAAIASVFARK